MEDTPVLRKPTATIHISNPFSFGARKLLNKLMHDAQTDDGLSDVENSVQLTDVYGALGWKSEKNEDEIKDYIRSLVTTPVEWNESRIDKSVTWSICTFLSHGKIAKGRLYYRINPEIVSQVRRPTLYAKMVLLAQTQLRRKTSLILYEYFQAELGRCADKIVELEQVPIATLLDILGKESEYYQQYKHFNREILKPATKEINDFTDISVYYTRVAKGKATIGVSFSLSRKESFQLSLNLKEESLTYNQHTSLIETLQHYGVTKKTSVSLANRYSTERIQGNIEHLKKEIANGRKISNKGAWLRRAIEEDYRPKKSKVDEDASRRVIAEREKKFKKLQEERRLEEVRRAYQHFIDATLKARFFQKSEDAQSKYRHAFLEKVRSENHTYILNEYHKSDLDNAFVSAMFFNDLHEELLTEPHEQSMEAFDKWQQSSLSSDESSEERELELV